MSTSETSTTPSLKAQFEAGLQEGELRIQSCHNCGKPNMYPRSHCPFCQSTDLGWVAAAGGGVLHSYTVVRAVPPRGFEDELPYALGIVKLDEGVQLLARLEPSGDGDWAGYACDVRVAFAPRPGADSPRAPVAWFALGGSS
jgi:uncharacterized OB-fold protein